MAYKAGNLVVDIIANDQVSNTLDKLNTKIGKLGKQTSFGDKKSGGLFSFTNFAKIGTFLRSMRMVANVGSQILQHGVDYTETLNLWQVAMGDNLSMAQDFVTEMNKAYGISEKTLMNAQAIFKNMIGSLGQISDTMAYNLSEAITQMAIDYSSLYNVSIDSAITKFQAALAGQVRPIRSVSGYDITENTLYQLYQSIGGTKTMRQLSRTEKQLLSILAIYKQMGASGALGDMEKTIDQVANQSRMMAENWEQLATWAGVSLQYILQEYDVFRQINAALIFTSELLKSIAFSLGYKTPDFANNWVENVEDTEKAVDDLQGKLLDFDKFRSLSGAETNVLGIDTKLMEAISGYTSEIGNASSEARKLAEDWMLATFWTKEANGELKFSQKAFDNWKNSLSNILTIVKTIFLFLTSSKIVSAVGNIVLLFQNTKGGFNWKTFGITTLVTILLQAYLTNEKFRESINRLFAALSPAFELLSGIFATIIDIATTILTPIIDLVAIIIELLDKTGALEHIIFILLGAGIVVGVIKLVKAMDMLSQKTVVAFEKMKIFFTSLKTNTTNTLPLATKSLTNLQVAGSALAGVFAYIAGDLLLSTLGEEARAIVAPIMLAVGAITALVMAMLALQGTMTWGTALPFITASIGIAIAGVKSMLKVDDYANGGLPDKGTLFRAGEAGAEIVYNTPSGQSGVANVQQIAQATRAGTLQAVKEWWSQARNDIPQFREVSNTGIYEVAKSEMRRRGEW